jgi:hypothetical protein
MVDIITRAALLLLTSMAVLMITLSLLLFDTSKYFGSFEVSFGYGCLQATFIAAQENEEKPPSCNRMSRRSLEKIFTW